MSDSNKYPHYTKAKSYHVHDGYEYLLFIPDGADGVGWEEYTEADYPERTKYRRKIGMETNGDKRNGR